MRNIRILIALCVILATAMNSRAQQTRMLTADKHNEYGLVYRLPVTALSFEVKAKRTVAKAGPYYQYAKRYIGTDKVVTDDYERWEILSVTAVPYGVPDDENQYLMQLKPGALTSICVADDGMLLAINKEVEEEGQPSKNGRRRNTQDTQILEMNPKAYLDFVNEDFLASQSSARQAQMLAESIMEVRDARISLTRGTAETMPSDGKQLELMLQNLEKQEKAMTSAFAGLTESEEVTRTFTFTPGEAGRSVLFRMSDFAGFVDADDYSGEPVYVNVEITREGELPVDAKGNTKELPKDAVIYNIPGAAKVSMTCRGKTLWSREVDCSQYGVQFGLQPGLFSDKKNRSYAVFNPATGALEKIADLSE